MIFFILVCDIVCSCFLSIDTGIAEEIIGHTVTDEFNKVLEVQQSKITNCYTIQKIKIIA